MSRKTFSLILATATSLMASRSVFSLSYDFDDVSGGRVLYALNGKPLRLKYNLLSSVQNALAFEWTIALLNGTNFTDLIPGRNSLSKFLTINITELRSSSLEFTSFDASLFNGSQFFVRSVFSRGGSLTSTSSPVLTLYSKEGVPPNFTVVEKRNYFMGEITVTVKLSAGWPLPNMTVDGTVLLPVQNGDNQYKYTFFVNTEQINDTVFTIVATNEVGNYSLFHHLLPLGLGGSETVSCKSVSQDPSALSCSFQAFPMASAVLTCLNNSFKISGQPTVDAIDSSGLCQVTQVFMAVSSNAMCLTNHTCILQVHNSISSKTYTDLSTVLNCRSPSPSTATPSSAPSKTPTSSSAIESQTTTTEPPIEDYGRASFPVVVGSAAKYQFRELVPERQYDNTLQAVSLDQIIELSDGRFKTATNKEISQANDTGFIAAFAILSVLAVAAALILVLYCSGKRNRKEAERLKCSVSR